MEKTRILIVDDEPAEAQQLKLNLAQTGRYEARVETWPQSAISAAHDFKPHLVMLDIFMPRTEMWLLRSRRTPPSRMCL